MSGIYVSSKFIELYVCGRPLFENLVTFEGNNAITYLSIRDYDIYVVFLFNVLRQ